MYRLVVASAGLLAVLSVPALAETLGIPPGTAYSRLHRALEAMHAALLADEQTAAQTRMRQTT